MDIEEIKQKRLCRDGLSRTLGMEFLSTPEAGTVQARMKVDGRNSQPFGFLSGGATLALAENIAGVGSMALCPEKICVGINVSGTHVRSVLVGDTVTATAKILHQGRRLHTWQVDIRNAQEETISTVTVTNYVMEQGKALKIDPCGNDAE